MNGSTFPHVAERIGGPIHSYLGNGYQNAFAPIERYGDMASPIAQDILQKMARQ
jgi:hypothetical protein